MSWRTRTLAFAIAALLAQTPCRPAAEPYLCAADCGSTAGWSAARSAPAVPAPQPADCCSMRVSAVDIVRLCLTPPGACPTPALAPSSLCAQVPTEHRGSGLADETGSNTPVPFYTLHSALLL